MVRITRCFVWGAVLALVGCVTDGEADDLVASDQAAIDGDRSDPAHARSDRTAATATVHGRKIVLHLSDEDNAGWASIEDGDPGDEVWLDRSFDAGASWDGHVGKTKIPSGGRSWRTMMYRVDEPGKHRFGALRACGKAGNRPEIACTPWFRTTAPGETRHDAAAIGLMQHYQSLFGRWNSGWWNSANALTAMLDYMQITGSTTHRWVIAHTFDRNRWSKFTNEYMDDTAWWGLAWVRAYDVTGEQRYLDMARHDAEYLWKFKDDKCGGGIWWRDDKKYKNAVTNELFIKLAASLHNRIPGDTVWLARAKEVWAWFEASGMINAENLINDGLDDQCRNNGQTEWTYNQGIILGGLVELHRATGDDALLAKARALADASTSSPKLHPNGILREPCESNADKCGKDGPSFKGAYVRGLGELDAALPDRPYRKYLRAQADAMYANARTTIDQYGIHWAGPFDRADASRQHSALDLLNAAAR